MKYLYVSSYGRQAQRKKLRFFLRRPSHFFPHSLLCSLLIDFVLHLPVAPLHCLSGYFLQLAYDIASVLCLWGQKLWWNRNPIIVEARARHANAFKNTCARQSAYIGIYINILCACVSISLKWRTQNIPSGFYCRQQTHIACILHENFRNEKIYIWIGSVECEWLYNSGMYSIQFHF